MNNQKHKENEKNIMKGNQTQSFTDSSAFDDQEFEMAAIEEIKKIDPNLPTQKLEKIVNIVKNLVIRRTSSIAISSLHSGPLPPPNILAKYDDVLPGAAERIMKMAAS